MKTTSKEEFDRENVFGRGRPNTGFARYFIGDSYLNPLTPDTCSLPISNVTFEPGCRNNWHVHHATTGGGQVLICTAGEGWCQLEGEEPVSMTPGALVVVPANRKHWHGAKKDSWFSHIAFMIPGTDASNEWLEPVEDEYYNSLSD